MMLATLKAIYLIELGRLQQCSTLEVSEDVFRYQLRICNLLKWLIIEAENAHPTIAAVLDDLQRE